MTAFVLLIHLSCHSSVSLLPPFLLLSFLIDVETVRHETTHVHTQTHTRTHTQTPYITSVGGVSCVSQSLEELCLCWTCQQPSLLPHLTGQTNRRAETHADTHRHIATQTHIHTHRQTNGQTDRWASGMRGVRGGESHAVYPSPIFLSLTFSPPSFCPLTFSPLFPPSFSLYTSLASVFLFLHTLHLFFFHLSSLLSSNASCGACLFSSCLDSPG